MEKIKKYLTTKNLLFIAVFAIIGFLALQIPVTELVGSKAKFTVFDAFAPITGAFIGSIPGVIAIILMQLGNFFIHGANILDTGTIIRFLPMVFAVLYFAKKGKLNLVIPALAILAFVLNPIGREVWYFSLFWTIPIICYFLRDKFLLARALGSTFTAHSIGGAFWIWLVPMPAEIWIGLIPIVIVERLLFTFGISASFVIVNNLVALLEKKTFLKGFKIESKYLAQKLNKN